MSKLEELILKYCPDGVEGVLIGSLIDLYTGVQLNKSEMQEKGSFPVINGGINPSGYIEQFNEDANTITISQGGASAGYVNYITSKFWAGAHCFVIKPDEQKVNKRYLYNFLKNEEYGLQNTQQGAGIPSVNRDTINSLLIPLPPLPVQEEIVRILDSMVDLQNNIEAELKERKKQYEHYRKQILGEQLSKLCPDGVVREKLESLLAYEQPSQYIVESESYDDSYKTPVLTAGQTFILGYTNETEGIYTASVENPVIIFDDFTTSFHWVDFDFKVKSSAMKILKSKTENNFRFIFYAMQLISFVPTEHSRHWISKYSRFTIPLPPLPVQEEIVRILDSMTALQDNLEAELVERRKQYEYYRNKLLSFE